MSRHGKFADDSEAMSVVIPKVVKAELRAMAKEDKRTLSNFVALELERIVEEHKTARLLDATVEKSKRVGV